MRATSSRCYTGAAYHGETPYFSRTWTFKTDSFKGFVKSPQKSERRISPKQNHAYAAPGRRVRLKGLPSVNVVSKFTNPYMSRNPSERDYKVDNKALKFLKKRKRYVRVTDKNPTNPLQIMGVRTSYAQSNVEVQGQHLHVLLNDPKNYNGKKVKLFIDECKRRFSKDEVTDILNYRREKDGATPLIRACRIDLKKVTFLLYTNGGSTEIVDHAGQNCMDHCVRKKSIDSITTIMKSDYPLFKMPKFFKKFKKDSVISKEVKRIRDSRRHFAYTYVFRNETLFGRYDNREAGLPEMHVLNKRQATPYEDGLDKNLTKFGHVAKIHKGQPYHLRSPVIKGVKLQGGWRPREEYSAYLVPHIHKARSGVYAPHISRRRRGRGLNGPGEFNHYGG